MSPVFIRETVSYYYILDTLAAASTYYIFRARTDVLRERKNRISYTPTLLQVQHFAYCLHGDTHLHCVGDRERSGSINRTNL